MQLNYFDYYVIGINVIGFLVFLVNHLLYDAGVKRSQLTFVTC